MSSSRSYMYAYAAKKPDAASKWRTDPTRWGNSAGLSRLKKNRYLEPSSRTIGGRDRYLLEAETRS